MYLISEIISFFCKYPYYLYFVKNVYYCNYFKDWHFTRDYPDEVVYTVPKYFSSDWLNEYLTSKDDLNDDVTKDDYRFVYMGPKGSWLVRKLLLA